MRGLRWLLVSVMSAVVVVAGLLVPAVVVPASAAPLSWERVSGPDRFGTAVAISKKAFPAGAPAAAVASGEFFADGLSASYLAGHIGGPLLLTRKGSLPKATGDELTRLNVAKIYVMGGTAAVSTAVLNALKAVPTGGAPMVVERVSGTDRYGTAIAAATKFPGSGLPMVGGKRTALLAGGLVFADALSGSAPAAGKGLPLLLTRQNTLAPGVLTALKDLGITRVVILGGEASISGDIVDTLRAAGMTVLRLGGKDRVETSTLIAGWTIKVLGFNATKIGLARGDNAGLGVDALAAGPFIGTLKHPLLLTASPTKPGDALVTWIGGLPALTGGYIFGGPASISQTLIDQLDPATATTWTSIAAGPGGFHTCGIRTDGTAWCWGRNDRGQLGDNTTADRDSPVAVDTTGVSGTKWTSVVVGGKHTCGIRTDGSAWCWGDNDQGQLGDNSTTDRDDPVEVDATGIFGSQWISVTTGAIHTCGIRNGGSAWCWGDNDYGQLGSTNHTDRDRPGSVVASGTPGIGWATVDASGYRHTCGIRTNGVARCWGENVYGQLGDNTETNRDVPVEVYTAVLAGGSWTSVSTGHKHTCGTRTDGSAWCWGSNDAGKLGNNTTLSSDVPLAVVSSGLPGTTWTSVDTGQFHTCGIRPDGSGWCWGDNFRGELGDGAFSERHKPVAVLTLGVSGTSWTSITPGDRHTCGIRTDGSAWCWGLNIYGQLGNNSTANSATPVAVGTGG